VLCDTTVILIERVKIDNKVTNSKANFSFMSVLSDLIIA